MMKRAFVAAVVVGGGVVMGQATGPAGARAGRAPAPVRDPHAVGYVEAVELKDGEAPAVEAEGNFILGPTHKAAPEMSPVAEGAAKGRVVKFVMKSEESAFYPGIVKDAQAGANGEVTSHAGPWTRTVSVYVPVGYVAGTEAPVMITCDGDNRAFNVLDHLVPAGKLPAMVVVAIPAGGGDGPGSERGLEYDTVSGKYSDWVETEVLPRAEKEAGVKLTKDPDKRAVMGTSSGGSCALAMAWFHPERYHRVLTFSGTFVNQQWPVDPAYPHGAWGFHETLIPQGEVKPLRIFLECGDRDNLGKADGMHDWVEANERMARVLAEKGYHYKFVFARGAGHTDRPTISELYPGALEWVWAGGGK
jgi:enterochelin esterase-like enzyme